jgi:hypothetical protein
MKKILSELILFLGFVLAVEIAAVLLGISNSTALVFSLVTAVSYLVYQRRISPGEAAVGGISFAASGLLFAAAGKYLFFDSLCRVAESQSSVESGIEVLGTEEVCLSIFEVWISALQSNVFYNWYFWVATVATGVLTAYLYRRYG